VTYWAIPKIHKGPNDQSFVANANNNKYSYAILDNLVSGSQL
jgi:hypothetical protein